MLNDSRVIPARLHAVNDRSAGKFEILLLEENSINDWWAMLRPGKRARIGTQLVVCDRQGNATAARATVLEKNREGHRRLRFAGTPNIREWLDAVGLVPLPPYIARGDAGPTERDRERYQTVFAARDGSVAAPTAGLHFTAALLDGIRSRGVEICFVTLHVGAGTFAPVKTEQVAAHRMHDERYLLSETTARVVNEARRTARRVIAVGTTSARVLESAVRGPADRPPPSDPEHASYRAHATRVTDIVAGAGRTGLFIYPPFNFKIVDALLTNFHLPRSTLLMLVGAFAAPGGLGGRQLVLSAYAEAIRERYRFFSYGDAMLIL